MVEPGGTLTIMELCYGHGRTQACMHASRHARMHARGPRTHAGIVVVGRTVERTHASTHVSTHACTLGFALLNVSLPRRGAILPFDPTPSAWLS